MVATLSRSGNSYSLGNQRSFDAWGNVRLGARALVEQSPALRERVEAGALRIVGARYDLDDGTVWLLDEATPPAK